MDTVVESVQLVLLFLAFTVSFVFTLNAVSAEKGNGMSGYLYLMGMKVRCTKTCGCMCQRLFCCALRVLLQDSSYWTALLVENAVLWGVVVALVVGLGYALPGLEWFRNSNVFVIIISVFVYAWTMVTMAFAISALFTSSRVASTFLDVPILVICVCAEASRRRRRRSGCAWRVRGVSFILHH